MLNLSEYVGLKNQLDDEGVFDVILDVDANYFINIKRLRFTKEKDFKDSYSKIEKFFGEIYKILSNCSNKNSILYK